MCVCVCIVLLGVSGSFACLQENNGWRVKKTTTTTIEIFTHHSKDPGVWTSVTPPQTVPDSTTNKFHLYYSKNIILGSAVRCVCYCIVCY